VPGDLSDVAPGPDDIMQDLLTHMASQPIAASLHLSYPAYFSKGDCLTRFRLYEVMLWQVLQYMPYSAETFQPLDHFIIYLQLTGTNQPFIHSFVFYY